MGLVPYQGAGIPGTPAAADPSFRVLVWSGCQGSKLEVVEYPSGALAIHFDGRPRPGYHWDSTGIEPCIATYLMLVKT